MYSGNGALEHQANDVSQNGSNGFHNDFEVAAQEDLQVTEIEPEEVPEDVKLTPSQEYMMQQELEGVEFYIAQGYKDFAERALAELEEKYGEREEFSKIRELLDDSLQTLAGKTKPAPENLNPDTEKEVSSNDNKAANFKAFDIIGEFRNELGLEEEDSQPEGDYETHYHLAIAYKEMGLMEESIKEFQDAINLSKPDDGTRRFFQCANLLGHCFMEKQMPNLAIIWYQRAFEDVSLDDEEKLALLYEIVHAYETGGDDEKALDYFGKVYAVDVTYRDTSARLKNLQEKIIQ